MLAPATAPGRVPRWSHVAALAAIVAAAIVVAWLSPAGSLASEPLQPFAFHDPGQPPLLLLRCGVLYFTLVALRGAPWRASIVGLLFVASLAARGLMAPFVLVAIVLAAPRPAVERSARAALFGAVVGALLLASAARLRPTPVSHDTGDPATLTAYWRGRQNLFQARRWALEWTRQEREQPADAYLALADIDWALGRKTQARKVLEKVVERSSSDAARAQAKARLAQWGDAL